MKYFEVRWNIGRKNLESKIEFEKFHKDKNMFYSKINDEGFV